MIIVRSPFRLPIAGGGTDLDFYYKKKGGDLISATIDQYIYILISKRPLDKKILIQNTETQFANNIKVVKNKLFKEVLKQLGLKNCKYFNTTYSIWPWFFKHFNSWVN